MGLEENMLSEVERLIRKGDHKGANLYLRHIKFASKDEAILKRARELWQIGVENALENTLKEAEKYSAVAHIDRFEESISKVERYAALAKKDISGKIEDLKLAAYRKAQNDCLDMGIAFMYQGIRVASEMYLNGAKKYSRYTNLDVSEAVKSLIATGRKREEIRPEQRVEESAKIFFSTEYNQFALRFRRKEMPKYEPPKVHFHT